MDPMKIKKKLETILEKYDTKFLASLNVGRHNVSETGSASVSFCSVIEVVTEVSSF
jgi:hypothetical protein